MPRMENIAARRLRPVNNGPSGAVPAPGSARQPRAKTRPFQERLIAAGRAPRPHATISSRASRSQARKSVRAGRLTEAVTASISEKPLQRSQLAAVRNPVLALSGVRRLRATLRKPGAASIRSAFLASLLDVRRDAGRRAQVSWEARKPPMACYWKVVSVLVGHFARAMR